MVVVGKITKTQKQIMVAQTDGAMDALHAAVDIFHVTCPSCGKGVDEKELYDTGTCYPCFHRSMM